MQIDLPNHRLFLEINILPFLQGKQMLKNVFDITVITAIMPCPIASVSLWAVVAMAAEAKVYTVALLTACLSSSDL